MCEKKKALLLLKMARLVSYKPKDENRYSTFKNESTVNPGVGYKESDLFKKVEIVKKTRQRRAKKSICSKCFTFNFWYKLCTCCCCCRCTKKKSGYSCCYTYDHETDTIHEDAVQIKAISGKSTDIQMSEINLNSSEKTKNKTTKKLSTKYWNWNDSLRSNSDRFLETLEYDLDGDRSLKKKSNRTSSKIPLYSQEESNASEMAGSSPIIGERHLSSGSASPVAANKSASTDPWPTQTDEDIDRLVALHKNRSSLSSLGLRSDSMASVYSGAGEGRYGTVAVKGQIEFGMQYNYKQGALEIHIVQCKDLAAVDTKRNRSDPYVKLYLLPDKSKTGKRKTKVKKHTLNPVFDETLKFYMLLNSLESRTLWLTVWHSDMFGRNDFLGEVMITLSGKVFDNPHPQWYTLQERSEPFDDVVTYKGDIIVGLKFVPPDSSSASQHSSPHSSGGLSLRKFGSIKSSPSSRSSSSKGSLHVLVKEGKNLNAVKANGFCDAFCKSYLLPDKNRSSKQKTPVIKRTVNPVWNYTFVYDDVSLQELSERALELTIWDHDRLSTNEFLGGIRFSLGTGKHNGRNVDWMDSTGKELSLWQNMLSRPNFWVEGSVILRSSLEKLN